MFIRTTKDVPDPAYLCQILSAHDKEIRRCGRMNDYYEGRHPILGKQARANGAPNNVIVANYCEYITNMSTGFFLGQPVSYTSDKEQEMQALQDVMDYNDESAHNMQLAEDASVYGAAYELLYMDEDAQIRFARLDPAEVILVGNDSVEEQTNYAIRHYRIYDVDGSTYQEFVDVYDKTYVTHYSYDGGSLRWINQETHNFDDVPIVEYKNNNHRRGDFEGITTLVDAYNKAQSLTLDDMEDFTDAYLILKNMSGTNDDDIKKLRRDKVILVEGDGGADWLIKNVNDTYIENVKTRIQKDIHKFSNIPDMSDESFTGNTSGIAIKYKLIGLEQVRIRKERGFRKALQHRIELIASMIDIKKQLRIDFRDIDISFTPNIPANVSEASDIVKSLYGIVSMKRLLTLLPFINDPAQEMDELKKEKEDEMSDDYAVLQKNSSTGDDGHGGSEDTNTGKLLGAQGTGTGGSTA